MCLPVILCTHMNVIINVIICQVILWILIYALAFSFIVLHWLARVDMYVLDRGPIKGRQSTRRRTD
jgi:hypothetical protein